jgi:glyoxylase-like metal-dependent hydrolase (beta-lactamase superfamily II)
MGMGNDLIFYQLFEKETSTYTYLLAEKESLEAIIIDPVLDTAERDLTLISELGVKLKYILETHIHADHITGATELRKRTGAKTAVSRLSDVECADILLDNNSQLVFGSEVVHAIATPGHTHSCMSFYLRNMVFTGDALLIRGTGRTDFQQGSATELFQNIRQKLFSLPEETLVYPAHDYKGHTHSTIGLEKKFNPRVNLNKSEAEFIALMNELKLDPPKKLKESLPANLRCGKVA